MYQHFGSNCASLYNASVGSKIALEYGDSACFTVWVVDRTDSLRVTVDAALDILAYGLACNSHAVGVDKSLFAQLVENCINSACFVEVFHVGVACRCKMAEVRSLGAYLVSHVKVDIYAAFVGDSREMEHTVCGTSKSHISCESVLESLLCHDIERADILSVEFHNLHTCLLCKLDTLGVNSRDSAVASETHTQYLSEAVHGVSGIHTRT